MSDETTNQNQSSVPPVAAPAVSAPNGVTAPAGTPIGTPIGAPTGAAPERVRRSKERAPIDRRQRRGGDRERVRPEFDQKMLSVRRVARVVAGGRRFSFSVLIALGNKKGSVGVGTGKAGDTALAIEKATKSAKKEMIQVSLTKNRSIPHRLEAKYSSAYLVMFPAPSKGLIAGSAVRAVLELAGITDINAKILSGSKNKLNIARATIKALSQLKSENTNSTDIRMVANKEKTTDSGSRS